MEMHFCRRCGTKLTNIERHIYKCQNSHTLFANNSPAVGVFFVTPDLKLILSERGIEPRKGMLDTFGGFVDSNETLEAALQREVAEETSLQPDEYESPRYLLSAVASYPYQDETLPVLTSLYWSRLKTTRTLKPADDVAAIHIIPLHELDLALLHDEDIRAGVRALRSLLPVNTSGARDATK